MSFLAPLAVGAAGSIAGGYLASSGKNKRTRTQKKNQRTIDDILAGIQGEGPYASLYSGNEDAFQKSYIDPAKAIFQNQIAPQIQQSYIASGLQRGTGMQGALTRAGVDLDAMINAEYMNYLNNIANRQQTGLDRILQADIGGQQLSSSDRFNQAAGGYLTSPEFHQQANNFGNYAQHAMQYHSFQRPGFMGGY